MQILIINSGSSSIKFSVFAASGAAEPKSVLEGELTQIGSPDAKLTVQGESKPLAAGDLKQAVDILLDACTKEATSFDTVGYRVVHPGEKLQTHQEITEEVLHDLEEAIAFAPLHDPAVLTVIRECMARFPALAHYACFDTVFHATMPQEATTYAIPAAYRELGVRRYGFHGLSCESIVYQLRDALPQRLIIAHLGSGCSVTAVRNGASLDTSMGLTPTGGVVMGTRPGDLDPGLLIYLLRQQKGEPAPAVGALEKTLNHDCGLAALSGQPNDMKAIRKAAAGGDPQAQLALKVFTRSITKAIGSYAWLMGGLDCIVFTGGIGEHDIATRDEVLVKTPAVDVRVLPAQENLMIARHVYRLEAEASPGR